MYNLEKADLIEISGIKEQQIIRKETIAFHITKKSNKLQTIAVTSTTFCISKVGFFEIYRLLHNNLSYDLTLQIYATVL